MLPPLSMMSPRMPLLFAAVMITAGVCSQVQAGSILGVITDKNGQPVTDAVLFAAPLDTPVPQAGATGAVTIAQENYIFLPYVSVIRNGTAARFLNRDAHDHHIKSFSPAKTFELRVNSKKEESAPILFDKTGEVVMVCFFHDWMRGFVYVVDTPYFSKTDKAGSAVLNNLPAGKYDIKAWVPNMLGQPLSQTVQVTANDPGTIKFQLNFVPAPAPRPLTPAKKKADPAAASSPSLYAPY